MIWHSASAREICEELESNLDTGLTEEQARQRLSEDGPNFVGAIETPPLLKRLVRSLKTPVSITLFVACVIFGFVESVYHADKPLFEPLIILLIYISTLVINVLRDHFCIDSIAKLKLRVAPSAKVMRGSVIKTVNAVELVAGDIIFIEKGDLIPADARLIESSKLYCDESAITGHSAPVNKSAMAELNDIAPLAERSNMVHSGCVVTYGSGRAIVTATAKETEVGKLNTVEDNHELSVATSSLKNLAADIRKMLPFIFGLLFIVYFLCIRFTEGGDDLRLLQIGATSLMYIATVIAAISPDGIASMATSVVTLGLHRMKHRGAIVTDTAIIDRFGKVSVVCADKASLTERALNVVKLFNGEDIVSFDSQLDEREVRLLRYAAICSDNGDDPSDEALINAYRKVSSTTKPELENLYPRLNELPFDANRGVMVTVNMIDGVSYAVVKGAPETVIEHCVGGDKEKYLDANAAFGSEALHVLAVAIKPLSDLTLAASPTADELLCDLEFLGLIGFVNPIREDAQEAVSFCKSTGTRPIMITGDAHATAIAIARQVGILVEDTQAISGDQLREMDELELLEKIDEYTVFSRISPADKVRIVNALQEKGHVVAITGRRPIDTAALRAADVGCAMGMTGTDAARNSAHVVLSDDNFSTIVAGINRASTMYECVRKLLHFILCCDLSLVLAVLVGFLVWQTPILQPIQMLFALLLFGLLPPIAFGLEPIHKRKASAKKLHVDNFFDGGRRAMVLWHSAVVALITVVAYAIGRSTSIALAGAMAYSVFIIAISIYSFSLRSRSQVVKLGLLGNPYMLIEIAATVIITFISLLSSHLGLGASIGSGIIWVILLSLIPLIAAEAGKLIKK